MIRSLLFLPGNKPNLLIHAEELGADAVIYDLEDSVAPDQKDAARILVRNALRYTRPAGTRVIVRVNALDSSYWEADLREIVPWAPDALMPPKAAGPETVERLERAVTELEARHGLAPFSVGILPLIETALGVENAFRIASASPRVRALFLGGEDLSADLGCQRTRGGAEIDYARKRLVCAARAAGAEAYDTPFTDVNDDAGARADAEYARSLGFAGKAAIAPRHVGIINETFSPTRAEIDYAAEVLNAIAEAKARGAGVVALRGKMIDAPVERRARRVMETAEALGLGKEGVHG